MTIATGSYLTLKDRWPQSGQHILAYQQHRQVVVYQAYNHQIADYAVQHQHFGGAHTVTTACRG